MNTSVLYVSLVSVTRRKDPFWCLYYKNLEYIRVLLGIGEFPKNKPAAARVSHTQASPASVSNSSSELSSKCSYVFWLSVFCSSKQASAVIFYIHSSLYILGWQISLQTQFSWESKENQWFSICVILFLGRM